MKNIKLFISWSKILSKSIAIETKEFLESVFVDHLDVLLFDVDGGKRIGSEIDSGLFSADLGILILTKENYEKNWLLFEAGALHSISQESTAIPILYDESRKMESPLADLAVYKFYKDDFERLFTIINNHIYEGSDLNDKQKKAKKNLFNIEWASYKEKVKNIIEEYTPQRGIEDVISGDLTSFMMDDSAYDNVLSRRENHLIDLIDSLGENQSKRIVFFGGISSILRTEETINKISSWLINNSSKESKIFFCYESSDLAIQRAAQLSDSVYGETVSDADKIKTTLDRKTELLQKMKSSLLETIGDRIQKRVFFVELNKLLTIYITIDQNTMYMTPALEKRSSETFTFKISNSGFNLQLLDYIEARIDDNCEELLTEIRTIKSEVDINSNRIDKR